MEQIFDTDKKEIIGLYRNHNGGIVVKNDSAYNKYLAEVNRAKRDIELVGRMDRLENMIEQLLERLPK